MEPEKTPNTQNNPEFEDLRICYKAVIIKKVQYWHKNRHLGQWNRIENPEMDPQMYGQLIFEKEEKSKQQNGRAHV